MIGNMMRLIVQPSRSSADPLPPQDPSSAGLREIAAVPSLSTRVVDDEKALRSGIGIESPLGGVD